LFFSVTGLSSDKEIAQESASTGVGLLAGSSILLLTVVWGTCVIIGKKKLINDSSFDGSHSSRRGITKSLTGLFFIHSLYLSPCTVFKFVKLQIILFTDGGGKKLISIRFESLLKNMFMFGREKLHEKRG